MPPRPAPPNSVRVLRWPVRPKGIRSIMILASSGSAAEVGAAALDGALVRGTRLDALEEAREVGELLEPAEHPRDLDHEGELDVRGGELRTREVVSRAELRIEEAEVILD